VARGTMATDILSALKERLDEDLDGLTLTPEGLQAVTDARFGELVIQVEHDDEAESVRVSVGVPPPAGAGLELLLWCLHVNTQYWDVKFGLDDDGRLLVHADLDADEDSDIARLASDVLDRAETVVDIIDDDLTEWLLARGLGTPAQQERWRSRPPKVTGSEDDGDED
ncbi:MAG: YbjN domain-containing protein, partial [Polyangiales bacterium]